MRTNLLEDHVSIGTLGRQSLRGGFPGELPSGGPEGVYGLYVYSWV